MHHERDPLLLPGGFGHRLHGRLLGVEAAHRARRLRRGDPLRPRTSLQVGGLDAEPTRTRSRRGGRRRDLRLLPPAATHGHGPAPRCGSCGVPAGARHARSGRGLAGSAAGSLGSLPRCHLTSHRLAMSLVGSTVQPRRPHSSCHRPKFAMSDTFAFFAPGRVSMPKSPRRITAYRSLGAVFTAG